MPTRVRIAACVKYEHMTWVTCDLLEGEVSISMLMRVDGRDDVWKIVGIAFSDTPELYKAGRREVLLSPQREGQQKLEEGNCLKAL